jgi:hypothetical protein
MAGIPSVAVEVAFDGGPFSSSYTWTDITDYVEGFQVQRGRNDELGSIESGTLSLTLDNSDGRFTPGKVTFTNNLAAQSTVTVDLSGRANNSLVHEWVMTGLDPDGLTRVVSERIWTNGPRVSCYFSLKWQDASSNTLKWVIGTRFVADSYQAVYTHMEAPPTGATQCRVQIWADTYPDGNTAVTFNGDSQSWKKAAPYYPNVLPRRRVRVRPANVTPKDVSTGGDITRSSAQFSTSHASGQSNSWVLYPKSGAGAVRVDFGNNGSADFASGVRCGFFSGGKPVGLAKVVAGQPYSVGAQIRLGATSPSLQVKVRIRWYDVNGSLISVSAGGSAWSLQNGVYVPISNLNQYSPTGAVWAGIEVGTTGGDGPNGYLMVDELQLEQGATLSSWTPGGSIFHGYIEKWPVSSGGLTAEVAVTAVDGLGILGTTELLRPMQQAIVTSDPVGYWTLGDPVGSTSLVNLADDTKPAKLVASKYGGATPLLGATSIVSRDDTTCYSLANVSSNTGTVVDICDGGKRTYPLGTDLTVAFWTMPTRPSAGSYVTLFEAWDDTSNRLISLRLDSSGYLYGEAGWTDLNSVTVNTSWNSNALSSSVPSFIVARISNKDFRLFVNGNDSASGSTTGGADIRDMKWASLGGAQAGSIYTEYSNGRHGHLAVWDRALTTTEISDFWKLGAGTALTELESARISRLATYAGFTGDYIYDAGMSTVQEPSWDTGATALDEIQTTAADAAGYAFIDGDGRLTYHSRVRRQSAAVRYTLGDTSGLPYEPGLSFVMDEAKILNEVTYKRTNGIAGTVRNADSVATYGRKSTSIERRITLDSEIQDAAYSLLNTYATPGVRCDQVTLNASATPGLFLIALGVEVGDRITLADLPTAAPDSSADFYVEAVNIQASADGGTPEWTATLSLSPASASDVWLLEDPILGRIDRTAVLAY